MRLIGRLIAIVFILAIVLFGMLFTIQNTATAPLDLLVAELPEQKVALWVLGAFALGGIVGIVACFFRIAKLKGELVMLRRKQVKQEEELNQLRTRAVKE